MRRNLAVVGLVVVLAVLMSTVGCRTAPKSAQIQPTFAEQDVAKSARETATARDARSGDVTRETLTPVDMPLEPEARDWIFIDRDKGMQDIYFAFDKSNLTPESRLSLEHNAEILKDNPKIRVLVEGHCDERGTIEYNLALGERRALAARNYLINLGIDPSRIATISYGEERPSDPRHNEEAWAKNRRDEFKPAD